MTMRAILIALPLLAFATGCASTPKTDAQLKAQAREAAKLDEALAGFTPGKAVDCVDNRDLRSPESYGDNIILFRTGSKLIYRTDTSGSCSGIGRGEALITRQWGSRLCKGDIARTADLTTGFQSGVCSFGEFVPYRKK